MSADLIQTLGADISATGNIGMTQKKKIARSARRRDRTRASFVDMNFRLTKIRSGAA